jgi:hypothetical protein
MNIFFNFVQTLNKEYMLKVGLSKFIRIQVKVTIYVIAFM